MICSVLALSVVYSTPEASPDGTTIYVTNTDGNSVKVISAATGHVTATIGVGGLPWQIVVSANGKTAYVTLVATSSSSTTTTTVVGSLNLGGTARPVG
jgi:YVTN family beta-propeller protein